jgi:hypothetical protein
MYLLSFQAHFFISYQILQHYAINYHESTYNLTANDDAEIDIIILCGQQFLHNYCNNPSIASLPPKFEYLKIQTKPAKLNKVAMS